MSDAAHMLSDVSSFLVAIFASWAATQPSTHYYSFGYHRAEILGAFISVLIIWLVTGALVYEAVLRTIEPVKVNGKRKPNKQQHTCIVPDLRLYVPLCLEGGTFLACSIIRQDRTAGTCDSACQVW